SGHPLRVGTARHNVAEILELRGDPLAAQKELPALLELFRTSGYQRGVAFVTRTRGATLLDIGDLAGARAAFRECHQLATGIGFHGMDGRCLDGLGLVDLAEG